MTISPFKTTPCVVLKHRLVSLSTHCCKLTLNRKYLSHKVSLRQDWYFQACDLDIDVSNINTIFQSGIQISIFVIGGSLGNLVQFQIQMGKWRFMNKKEIDWMENDHEETSSSGVLARLSPKDS